MWVYYFKKKNIFFFNLALYTASHAIRYGERKYDPVTNKSESFIFYFYFFIF
jgi:hypothetical protein